MSFFANLDLHNPLTDHPFWKEVRGVWVPLPQLRAGSACAKLWDLSGYGNHATQSTAADRPVWSNTPRGMTIYTDGAGDNVVAASSKSLDLGTTSHASFVVVSRIHSYLGTGTVGERFFDKGDTEFVSTGGYEVGLYTDKHNLVLRTNVDDSICESQKVLLLNTWYSVAAIVDSDYTPTCRFVVDGIEQSNTSNNLDAIYDTDGNDLHIAGYGVRSLNGDIAFAAVLGRSLTNAEIAFFHEQSLKGYPDLFRRTSPKKYFYYTDTPSTPPTDKTQYGNIFKSVIVRAT